MRSIVFGQKNEFLPAVALGAVCLGEGFLCMYVRTYESFQSDMWDNYVCMVFGRYFDIRTDYSNFWKMNHMIPNLGSIRDIPGI